MDLEREATLYLDLLNAITRRARQEISHVELDSILKLLNAERAITPFAIEGLLTNAAGLQKTDPALASAAAEASLILARHVQNPEISRLVDRALGLSSETLEDHAERELRQGRPDLAVPALHNLAVHLRDINDFSGAEAALRRAWELVLAIGRGDEYLPRAAVYDSPMITVQIAEPLVQILIDRAALTQALELVDSALRLIQGTNWREEVTFHGRRPICEACVRLLIKAAHCEAELGNSAAVESRSQEALRLSRECASPLASVTAHLALSHVAFKRGDRARDIELLTEAQRFADRYRRSFAYEADKSSAATDTQAAYVWAGERLIELGRTLEAWAAFEGLRSRALLDMLGLTAGARLPTRMGLDTAKCGKMLLDSLLQIAFPGQSGEAWGLGAVWRQRLQNLDEWLDDVSAKEPTYRAMVSGASVSATELQDWISRAVVPTAVLTWMLGERYSYIAVASSGAGAPLFVKTDVTIKWLREQIDELQSHVQARQDPPTRLLEALSLALLDPVRDAISNAEILYACPTQILHELPIGALPIDGVPLALRTSVAVVPSISVLRVLQFLDRTSHPVQRSVVFGPDFPDQARTIAALLGTRIRASLTEPGLRAASPEVEECLTLHLVCHGYWDENDPWQSGFRFGSEILTGRDLLQWRLQARLATVEACDTHRGVFTTTDDNFGLARFLHLIGVPSLLLSDWEVRNDVSLRFMHAFYRALNIMDGRARMPMGRGLAYRAAMKEVYDWAGPQRSLLWAPFTLAGVAE